MIAFHFPPAAMGSGHLRTLGFARYLPQAGWDPIVLSAAPRAYPRRAPLQEGTIPDGCRVRRAFALDAGRHFAVAGKYPGFIAQPDRWSSWWPAAVFHGLRLIRRHRVRAIWSTYPIMTSHCVAYTLHRITHLPWVADFRDPVSHSVSPQNPFAYASQHRWERRVLDRAARVVLTTPGAARAYAERYPEAARSHRLAVIENGYDEADFSSVPVVAARRTGPFTLLHSGLLYPDGRDPSAFFAAISKLKRGGKVGPDLFRVILRASGSEPRYQQQIDGLDIADMVSLAPPVGSREALVEQATVDGLLLFQGSRFDQQIPAKLYEYLRVGKPIFALVGENGDTANLLRQVGGSELAPLDDEARVAEGLLRFLKHLVDRDPAEPCRSDVARWSRRHRSAELAQLLQRVAQ